jgi:hypothetical protein
MSETLETTMEKAIVGLPIAGRSLREDVRKFIESALNEDDTVNTDKLIRLAYAYFQDDPWVKDELIRFGLKTLVSDVARNVRWQRRTAARLSKDPSVTRSERIASVFESTRGGATKNIFAMRRPDHRYVAGRREARVAGELRWIGLHRAFEAAHNDDTTTTGELPRDLVEKIWREHIEQD